MRRHTIPRTSPTVAQRVARRLLILLKRDAQRVANDKIRNTHLDEAAHQEFIARMNVVREKHPHLAARGGIIARDDSFFCGVCREEIVKVENIWTHGRCVLG